VQAQESIRERAAIRPGINHAAVVHPRQVPKIAERAAVLFVEERPDFLGKTTHAHT